MCHIDHCCRTWVKAGNIRKREKEKESEREDERKSERGRGDQGGSGGCTLGIVI